MRFANGPATRPTVPEDVGATPNSQSVLDSYWCNDASDRRTNKGNASLTHQAIDMETLEREK